MNRTGSGKSHDEQIAAIVHRTTCWICEKPIKPDKAPRALCGPCACSGGLGPYT